MPIQPIKIPQNVQIEDRIVGPLTLRQLLITGMGCGLSYALWSSASKAYGYVGIPMTVILWIPGALSALFAFIKINDLSMLRICLLMLERLNKPAQRTWSPRSGLSINIRTFTAPKHKNNANTTKDDIASQQIEDISTVLDGVIAPSGPTEPAEEVPITTPDAAWSPTRPVDKNRISASASEQATKAADGFIPVDPSRPAVTVFRDISPRSDD